MGNHWVYVADNSHFPWGSRSIAELAARLRPWTLLFEERGATDLLIACNSACAVWKLAALGDKFPRLRVHQILEAGVRAVVTSGVERVGVAATEVTVRSGA